MKYININKHVKKIVFLMMILVLIFHSTGCLNNKISYKVLTDDKGYYIDIDGVSTSDPDGYSISASLKFDSLKDLEDTLKNFKFTPSQLRHMAIVFSKDEDGKIRIPYFDNFYYPIYPGEYKYGNLGLKSDSYSFYFRVDGEIMVVMAIMTDSAYVNAYEWYYDSFYTCEDINNENRNVNIIEHVFDEERNADVYYYNHKHKDNSEEATFKRVRYTLKNDSKTLIVDERYRLVSTNEMVSVSDEIPIDIRIFGEQDDQKFFSFIYDIQERPSEEWLLGVGIEKYVEE